MKNVDYFFFDFDDTLFLTEEKKAIAFKEFADENHLDYDTALINDNNKIFDRYDLLRYSLKLKNLDQHYEKIKILLDQKVFKLIKEADEILCSVDFLKGLNKLNKKCFIFSNSPEAELKKYISFFKLNDIFSEIYGRPNNKNENYEIFNIKYNVPSNKIVMFGDSYSDLVFSKQNQIQFIGINIKKNQFVEKKLKYNFNNFLEVIESKIFEC